MIQPIPLDATEVVLYMGFGTSPRVIKVDRHTDQQVVASGLRFRRSNGMQIGGGYTSKRIGPVTPEALSHIKAAELQDTIADLERKVRNVAARQVSHEIALVKGKDYSIDFESAERAVRELTACWERRVAELPKDDDE